MRIYLAGPMSGLPLFNFPAFHAAAKRLRDKGYVVVSPAEMAEETDGFDPATDEALPSRHYVKRDLPAMLDCDAVALLPGWEGSRFGRLEAIVAMECGLEIRKLEDF